MFAVSRFLAITRGRTGSKRVDSYDSVPGGDKDVVKILDPLPAPVASEVVVDADKLEPKPTEESPPQLASGSPSEVVPSEPTEGFKTPPEDTPKQSTWTGDETDTVVHEPEETQSLETKVESKAPSERQGSVYSSLRDENDLQEPIKEADVQEEQKDNLENLPETVAIPEAEPLSEKESLPIDRDPPPTEPHEEKPDLQDLIRTDLETASLTKEGSAGEVERMKTEMEDIRRAYKENEDAARKETQRVKRIVAVERHSHSERMKEFKQEKEELGAALEVARKETHRVKGIIAVERHSHTERAKELKQENEELGAALEVARKETQRVKGIIAVERHSHTERAKELKQENEELGAALEAARKETQRVKGIIAVERHSHTERTKELKQENEELSAALEVARSNVLVSAAQIESQNEKIRGLEGQLGDSHEETREIYDKYHEQESAIKRLQEDILEERDQALMKDSQLHSHKVTNQSLSTSLVELQAKVNKTERHNRMLLEQVRQQSDQLQNRQYTDIFGTGLGRFVANNTLSAFSSLTRGIRRGAATARADSGIKILKQLNDEMFQLGASLTDQLEGIDKRFVSDDSLSSFAGSEHHESIGVRRVKAEYLKSTLGLELINRLEKDAPYPMKDINPFYVQVALQGCLTACCMRIITSWYPSDWEYGRFLEVLYEKIRGTGGLDMALNWRKTTQQNCVPSLPRDRNSNLVDYLKDDLRTVLSVSGWSRESDVDAVVEGLRENLFNLVTLALQLNTMTAIGVPGELEPILIDRESLFDWREMGDDCAPNRSRRTEMIPKEETVVCAVALGLKWSDGSDVDMPRLLLKPRVVLDSAIVI